MSGYGTVKIYSDAPYLEDFNVFWLPRGYCLLSGTADDPVLVAWCESRKDADWALRNVNEAGLGRWHASGLYVVSVTVAKKIRKQLRGE